MLRMETQLALLKAIPQFPEKFDFYSHTVFYVHVLTSCE